LGVSQSAGAVFSVAGCAGVRNNNYAIALQFSNTPFLVRDAGTHLAPAIARRSHGALEDRYAMTMNSNRGSTVVGVFEDRDDARDAIEALKDAGFDADTISILSPDKRATQEMAEETGTHAGSGAATGAVAGGILGGLGGWLVGIGALAIPGVGPFIAAGAFATALGGAAIGAGVGAIAGALVGMGVPEEHAKYYEGEARAGRTLVTIRADDRYDEAQEILRDHDAYDVESRGREMTSAGTSSAMAGSTAMPSGAAPSSDRSGTMELRQEELVANKQQVESGRVEVGKDVVSEERTIEVPVTREEVTIERTPVERRPSDRPLDDGGESISVPVHEERAEVAKRAVVYEEVAVGTRQVQDVQLVSDTVRREEARIDRDGDVNVTGWDQAMPTYRVRWQSRFGSSGERWEDAEPSYRYGYEMRDQPTYRDRSWSEVEPELQRDWSGRNPTTPWDRAKESIRETWEDRPGR